MASLSLLPSLKAMHTQDNPAHLPSVCEVTLNHSLSFGYFSIYISGK